jgi:pyruvate/2-oxoglutarate dehydrogenase complex dihydrolipoamide dehydrogenase (E3) component
MAEFDVVVIGMGPGGEEVGNRLAQAGLEVAGVEANLLGGECPYWGCIPSKMMIRAANLLAEARRVAGMAGEVDVRPDWAPVARRVREATDNWDDRAAVERFVAHGGHFFRGRGRLFAPGVVEVAGERLEARRGIVIATGGQASIPPIEGLAGLPFWTNREAIEVEVLPESLTIIGGGAIALELGQVYARFGVRVHVLEAGDRILGPEEPESSALLTEVLTKDGLELSCGVHITSVAHSSEGFAVTVADGPVVTSEQLLVATGRRPDLSQLGLEVVGVDTTARALATDDHQRVKPGIWAIGDVTGVGAFTHISMYQAQIAIADILGERHLGADYRALPRVTFTDPEIGSVGLSEQQARAEGRRVATGSYPIPSSTRGWIHNVGNDGFIKLVADVDEGVLVGATSAGPVGGEVLGLLALAVHAAVPISTLTSLIYAYPTFHRAIEPALGALVAAIDELRNLPT